MPDPVTGAVARPRRGFSINLLIYMAFMSNRRGAIRPDVPLLSWPRAARPLRSGGGGGSPFAVAKLYTSVIPEEGVRVTEPPAGQRRVLLRGAAASKHERCLPALLVAKISVNNMD